MGQSDYQELMDRESYARYEEILSRKDEVYGRIVGKSDRNVFNRAVKVMIRVAAVMVPFVVVTVMVATNMSDKSIVFWRNEKKVEKREVEMEKKLEEVIVFREANMGEILRKLADYYPEIKGIKGEIGDDSVLVTTEFSGQSLEEVIEELNIHFGEKIKFDGDYVVVSD